MVHDGIVDFDPDKPGAVLDEECARRASMNPLVLMPTPNTTPLSKSKASSEPPQPRFLPTPNAPEQQFLPMPNLLDPR
jgi:hypothetical protein